MLYDGPQYAETEDAIFVAASNRTILYLNIDPDFSAEDALRYLGRIYQDKDAHLLYRINDILYDDTL